MQHIMVLYQTVNALLIQALNLDVQPMVLPWLPQINSASVSAHKGCIEAVQGQYQRMAIAAAVPRYLGLQSASNNSSYGEHLLLMYRPEPTTTPMPSASRSGGSTFAGFPPDSSPASPPPIWLHSGTLDLKEDEVIALFSFTGEQDGDLHFWKGDKIKVTWRTDYQSDWWNGQTPDGRRGAFPANYVKVPHTSSYLTRTRSTSSDRSDCCISCWSRDNGCNKYWCIKNDMAIPLGTM